MPICVYIPDLKVLAKLKGKVPWLEIRGLVPCEVGLYPSYSLDSYSPQWILFLVNNYCVYIFLFIVFCVGGSKGSTVL